MRLSALYGALAGLVGAILRGFAIVVRFGCQGEGSEDGMGSRHRTGRNIR
jgi:hypothetical protein